MITQEDKIKIQKNSFQFQEKRIKDQQEEIEKQHLAILQMMNPVGKK